VTEIIEPPVSIYITLINYDVRSTDLDLDQRIDNSSHEQHMDSLPLPQLKACDIDSERCYLYIN
jgi:hypothetical protein